MPHKSPHLLQNGNVLAEDVHNIDGNLLFAAGTLLDEERIEILMMWGVESVLVGEDDVGDHPAGKSFSENSRSHAESIIKERLKLVKSSHPAVIAIREIAILEEAQAADQADPQS